MAKLVSQVFDPKDIGLLRHRAEEFRSVLEIDRFELLRGRKSGTEHSRISDEYSQLTSIASIEAVEAAIAAESYNVDERRRLEMLRAWLVQSFAEHEVRDIDTAIEDKAGEGTFIDDHGRLHPLRDARPMLAFTDDPEERRRLDGARIAAARTQEPLLVERLYICHGIARNFGKASFLDLWKDCLHVDVGLLETLATEVLASTDDMYREVLGWAVRKRLGVALEDAHRRDIPYVLAGRFTDYGDSFTPAELLGRTREFLAAMGIPLSCDDRLSIVLEDPPGPPDRIFVSAPRIPKDVRLVLRLSGKQRDLLGFLGSLGRALFLASIAPSTPFEERVLGDGALDLSYSCLFENLLLDRDWLKRALGIHRTKDYLIQANLERLYDLRLVCARVLWELQLYRTSSVAHMPARFADIFRRALAVATPPELYLHEVRKPFLSAFQLRARVFTALMGQHLAHYFNKDWWQNPQAGPFLRKEWSQGRRFEVEARSRDMGYEGLIVAPLLKQLAKVL